MGVILDGEDGEGVRSEEEGVRRAADVKYDEFKRECGDLLDPELEDEFTVMQSLGLPTKLINSYGDMDSEVGHGRCVAVVYSKHLYRKMRRRRRMGG